MKNQLTSNHLRDNCRSGCKQWLAALVLAGSVFAAERVAAQTTNAFDNAADATYVGLGAPNGLGAGGQNGGFGFGAWTFTVNVSGGSFIQNGGPSGKSFDLWNTGSAGSTIATRAFNTPLVAGDSFTFSLRLNGLRGQDTNRIDLKDVNGNVLFSYWHKGGDNLDGWYADAGTNSGVAVNFPYAYQSFQAFRFTLTSATTYTFTDLANGANFSGTISNAAISQFTLTRQNGTPAPSGGQDFQFDNFIVTAATPASFQSVSPAPNSISAATNATISLNVASGSVPLNTSVVSMKVDGNAVTPTIGGNPTVMSLSYTPATPFSYASQHSVQVIVQDANTVSYTNTWSFTVGYAALPVTLAGPFTTGGGIDLPIFTTAGEGWIGTNYNNTSTRTLYTRFSMVFSDLNGEFGTGGGYGGLQFFENNGERLIAGNAWTSLNWSMDANGNQQDLIQGLPVTLGEWHTIVIRTDYTPNAPDTVRIWLDPDFGVTEADQSIPPTTFNNIDATFNNIRLRCGNGTASATWTNIIVAITSAGVGFVAPSGPQFQGFVPGENATGVSPGTPISVTVLFGTYGIGTNNTVLSVDNVNVTPAFVVTPSSITANYQPVTPFIPGSTHTVAFSVVDSNSAPYSTSWSFTVDSYPSLPVTLEGPVDVFGGGDGVQIWNQQHGWIAGHYDNTSTNSLYARFSMVFQDLNSEVGNGGGYGGLHFWQNNNEVLIVGNAWASTNWSMDAAGNQQDLSPVVPIELNTWHTMVVKTVFVSGGDDNVTIWLDPDFSRTENAQTNAPFSFAANASFNNVRLRCGNGTASASFTNIIMAATGTQVGFATQPAPSVLSIQNAGANVNLSWTSVGVLQEATSLTGPWTNSANQSNPQSRPSTGSAMFFRLKQ
ncbi:MAG: Ig-like domain-containing protein [Verrucomicrobiota bacterium]